ncbi:hypothetical protein HHS_00660 [Candidatus Pantoea carbekii]|uniref:Uncharacterized protein n=1 Tax=Candidatus Pantoea carbekii TaxID=1235990 RepID=U3U1N6_9GAMM|nr:hypothetical protein HHS_00660 [Candidatus Pantoea carbekii]
MILYLNIGIRVDVKSVMIFTVHDVLTKCYCNEFSFYIYKILDNLLYTNGEKHIVLFCLQKTKTLVRK